MLALLKCLIIVQYIHRLHFRVAVSSFSRAANYTVGANFEFKKTKPCHRFYAWLVPVFIFDYSYPHCAIFHLLSDSDSRGGVAL